MCESTTVRVGCIWSKNGIRQPTLALKSPQTSVVSWGWSYSITSARRDVAWASAMPLRARDDAGGKYTFTTFMRWLFGSTSLASYPYSFPTASSS